MKSKSYDPRQKIINQVKENKSFKFVGLYKTAAETINEFNTGKWNFNLDIKPEMTSNNKGHMRSHKRKKGSETVELPDIASIHSNSSVTNTNNTSNVNDKKPDSTMKSIMKNKPDDGLSSNESNISSKSKPKKRSKSVSFMLEVSAKKSKSDKEEEPSNKKQNKHKAHKKFNKDKKELDNGDTDKSQVNTISPLKKKKIKEYVTPKPDQDLAAEETRKVKKAKKFKPPPTETIKTTEEDTVDGQTVENKKKKNKKKRKAKSSQDTNTESEEPAFKQSKKELKPENIAKGLESLNIGDNPHTLTNLLDEMTVVDKKKNKDRRKHKKDNKDKKEKPDSNESQDKVDTMEEVEKVKWKNRKWNKDTKMELESSKLLKALVVDNLPLKIMCNYKTRLAEHFNKFGTISGIGVAEAFPNDDPNPVFTTTIYFKDSDAATKALDEDNTLFEGNRIRVRRPLPPNETTLVIRAYADMTDQALSSIFSSAGRIRSIRHLVKGKRSICTAFVEFDGPEAVDRAISVASETKINGKKMYAARYENRSNSHSKQSQKNNESIENDNGLVNSSD